MKKLVIIVFLAMLLMPSAYAQNLVLAPTRIVLEGRVRQDKLMVSNPSDKVTKYRVELKNRRMLENGMYEDVETPIEGERFADRIVRLSPRSFTLEPKSSQTIRVQVRKPKDLADGEYRSHIQVQVVPDTLASKPAEVPGQLGIQVKVNYGMTIPLIVRHGDVKATASISDIELVPAGEDGKPHLKLKLSREGNASTYGDIAVMFNSSNGKEYLLKFLPGLSVFVPNAQRTFDFPLEMPDGLNEVKGGKLVVSYRKQAEDGGELMAEQSKDL